MVIAVILERQGTDPVNAALLDLVRDIAAAPRWLDEDLEVNRVQFNGDPFRDL